MTPNPGERETYDLIGLSFRKGRRLGRGGREGGREGRKRRRKSRGGGGEDVLDTIKLLMQCDNVLRKQQISARNKCSQVNEIY
jgi:hypothetical protein